MASRLRSPAVSLALATLSICLNVAIIGTAGRTLSVFDNQQRTNNYFLPLWPQHFDMREPRALLGTSAAIVGLNAMLAAALLAPAFPTLLLGLATTIFSSAAALVAIILPTVLNNQAPGRETVQTWTCSWKGVENQAVPSEFGSLCYESRFAFYTTIPSFVLQLALLALSIYAVVSENHTVARPKGWELDEEKRPVGSSHTRSDVELTQVEVEMKNAESTPA